MQIRTGPGRKLTKSPNDRIVYVLTAGEEVLKMKDLALMFSLLAENEDRLYPKADGNRGGDKLLDYLRDVRRYGLASAGVRHGLDQLRLM